MPPCKANGAGQTQDTLGTLSRYAGRDTEDNGADDDEKRLSNSDLAP